MPSRPESRIIKIANVDIEGDLAEQGNALDLSEENHQGRGYEERKMKDMSD
jgi:hypothetical protein